MKYFTKYLPVEGKIKEGDKVLYSGGQLGFPKAIYDVKDSYKENCSAYKDGSDLGIKWNKGEYTREDGKTVKQSAYLKIGYNIFLGKHLEKVKLFLCSKDIQVGDTFNEGDSILNCVCTSKTKTGIYSEGKWEEDYHNPIKCFKIIGEISLDANWVTEGMEFEEKDVLFSSRDVTDDTQTIVHIQCPTCKHFH